MKTTNVIIGFAAAALAGAAIGMLLAPEKGSDLQRKIKDEAAKWLDEVKKLVNNGKAVADEAAEEADRELSRIKSNLKPIED
jgi:gas vesicle protein